MVVRFFRSWWVYVKAVFTRFKLRYGWAVGGVKEDSKQLEAGRFAKMWNQIVDIFREEDLISDSELELLEMPSTQHISVFQWPSTLLANEVRLAVEQVQKHKGNDKSLWRKICANDYRRCAVIESYETIKFVLREIIRESTTEYQRFLSIYEEIDMSIRQNRFTTTFKLKELPKVHEAVLELVKDLLAWPTHNDPVKVVVRLQNLYEVVLCDFTKDMVVETKIRDSAPYQHQANGEDSELPVELPSADNHSFFKQLKRLQTTLSTKESLFNVPKGLEARRRISFFSNSLFMTMPRAPSVLNISNSELCKLLQILLLFLQFLYKALYSQLFFNWVYMIFKVIDGPCCGITWQVDKMLAFSVLTPYYKEDVIYSMKALSQLNEDGVSILYYLKTIFADDWRNFKQRFPNPDLKPDQSEDDTKFIARMEALDDAIEIRMWASYRGQTLARTVRGMMYYERSVPLSFEEVISREGFIGQCVRWYAVKF
jgi:callose synthase